MDNANYKQILTHLPSVDSLVCDTGVDVEVAISMFIGMGVTQELIDWCDRVHAGIQAYRFEKDDKDVRLRWQVHEAALPDVVWELCASVKEPYQTLYFLDILGRPAAYPALVQHILQTISAKSFLQSNSASSTTMS